MFSATKSLVLLSAHQNVALNLYYRSNYNLHYQEAGTAQGCGFFPLLELFYLVDKY